jgi:arylsulfatase A-like enzyme
MLRVFLIALLSCLLGCSDAPPVPCSTGADCAQGAVSGPGFLLRSPALLSLPAVPTAPPEVLRSWAFDGGDGALGVLGVGSTVRGGGVVAEAGRAGGGLRLAGGLQVEGGPERAVATTTLGLPRSRRRCTVAWAWRQEGKAPPLAHAARVRLVEQRAVDESGGGSENGDSDAVLGAHRSPTVPPADGSWAESEVSFTTSRDAHRLELRLEGPQGAGSAVVFDDVEVRCDTTAVSRYATAPLVEGVDPALPLRRVTAGRAERPAVLLPTPARWSLRVDRSQPLVLRTALAIAAPTPGGAEVCGVVRVDGGEQARVCRGGSGRKKRGWSALTVPLEAAPGRVSTVELVAEALPRADGRLPPAWVAWSDPRLDPPAPPSSPPPDVLLVLLEGVSEPVLAQRLDQLPALRELRRSSATVTAARPASADLRATAASLLTGAAPGEHGARLRTDTGLRAAVHSVAEDLRAQGYDTALFPSSDAIGHGLERGFAHVQRHSIHRKRWDALAGEEADQRAVAALRRRWVDEAVRVRPRFAVVELQAAASPHRVARGPAVLQRLGIDPASLPPPVKRRLERGEGLSVPRSSDDWEVPAALQELGQSADLARTDALLAELLGAVPDDTWVVVAGLRGEPRPGRHDSALDESLVRLPLIVRDPGRVGLGTIEAEEASLTSVADQLRALAGAPLRGPPAPEHHLLGLTDRGSEAVALIVDGRWKVVTRLPWLRPASGRSGAQRTQAYDLRSDPEERSPLDAEALPDHVDRTLPQRWLSDHLPGQHLRCPRELGTVTVHWLEAPRRVHPLRVGWGLLASEEGLVLPPPDRSSTWVVFPLDTVLDVPAGCSLARVPAGPPTG